MNNLREMLNETVAAQPPDDLDLGPVLTDGRRRVRRRRLMAAGGTALASAAVVAATSLVSLDERPPDLASAGVPQPDAPTIRLSDAATAVEGRDFEVLTSHTNKNLNRDNGQYYDGVTDDGLILFRDGPRAEQLWPRFALLDPATGEKDWLPDLDIGQTQTRPLELREDRLFLLSPEGGSGTQLVVHVFDRESRTWSTVRWPGLPNVEDPYGAVVGPDDRLYVPVPADGNADADAFHLWSASLADQTDVRDEGLTVGSLAFTDDSMVWTDSTNGGAGELHVRDLATGAERAFDPQSGERCNLLTFGAAGDRIVMGQYCGTYDDGVRDDRVQVLDTEGEQVVTLQGSGIEGGLTSREGAGLVTLTSYEPGGDGTYVYDLATGRFLQITEEVSSWATGGPVLDGQLLWNVPVNEGRGMTQYAGSLID